MDLADRYFSAILANVPLALTAICQTIGVLVFQCYGKSDELTPDWKDKEFSWSFHCAIAAAIFINIANLAMLHETYIMRRKKAMLT